MRRISEVNTIPDIRERNDRPKDKQPKHQVTSTVQRQMVQKFVKELSDSAKQPDRSDSAERIATEQVETAAREIVHEAVQPPRRAIQYSTRRRSEDSSASVQPERSDQPRHAPELPRERTDAPRTRSDATPPQSTSIPAAQEQARRAYVQQTAKTATPAPPITSEQPQHTTVTVPSAENAPRQRTEDVRTRPDPKQPQSASAPTPQEQARRVYVQQAAKEGAPAPSIMPEQPRERHVVRSAPLTENTPRQRTEDVRTHSALKQRQSAPTAQEQGRRAYVKRAKKSRAEKSSARDNLYTEQVEIRLADDMPQSATPPIRERPTITELRGEPRPEPTPENASNVQHIKQTGTWTPRGTEPYSRGIEQPIRERPAVTPAHDLPSAPQEQARQAFVEKQAQLSQNPSIESIYPSEPADQFCRSRLFRKHPQLRQSVSRSRLAANRPHLSSHQHQRTPHQWSSCPPSARSRSQTPHREKNPGATFLFGQEIQSKSRLQRRSQKRLYQKLIQSVRGKQLHRMHSEKCLKRVTTAQPEQPPQPRKS